MFWFSRLRPDARLPSIFAAEPGRGIPAFHVPAGGELRGFTFQGRLFLPCSGHLPCMVCVSVCVNVCVSYKQVSLVFFFFFSFEPHMLEPVLCG